MSASNRKVIEVRPYVNTAGSPRCVVQVEEADGSVAKVALHSLSRPELRSAASLLFPGIPGNVWLRLTNEVTQTLIRNGDEAAAKAAVEAAGASLRKSDKPKAPTAPAPADTTVADKAAAVAEVVEERLGGGSTPTAAERLQSLIEELGGKGVDQDAIDQAVEAKVEAIRNEIVITRVEIRLPSGVDTTLPPLAHKDLPKVVAILSRKCNLFLVGPAGNGKSTIVKHAAQALGLPLYPESFGPDTLRSQLFGFIRPDGTFQAPVTYKGFTEGGVCLGDELDRGHPGVITALNQMLANDECGFPNGTAYKHDDFRYCATANTYGRGGDRLYIGANQLDAASLDRFVFFELGIDEAVEDRAALAWSTEDTVSACREWIALVRKARANAAAAKLPIVIGPRSSIDGCKLISTGCFTQAEVVDSVLLKGAGDSIREKIQV